MKINVQSILSSIVEEMLPRFSSDKIGLYVKIDISYWFYSESGEEDVNQHSVIETFFVRPSNYTKVFIREGVPDLLQCNRTTEWELTSDHDSCWRSDGLRIFHNKEQETFKMFEDKGIERKDICSHVRISIFGGGPKYLEIKSLELNREGGAAKIIFSRSIPMNEISSFLGN
jgi:hypothetical protein